MDAALENRAKELAGELAGKATTISKLNEVVRSLMKTLFEKNSIPNWNRTSQQPTFALSQRSLVTKP